MQAYKKYPAVMEILLTSSAGSDTLKCSCEERIISVLTDNSIYRTNDEEAVPYCRRKKPWSKRQQRFFQKNCLSRSTAVKVLILQRIPKRNLPRYSNCIFKSKKSSTL